MYLFRISLKIITLTFLLVNAAFSQDTAIIEHPVYKDGKLTIPRVDTDVQAGNFQDVEFQFDDATNTWKLLNYRVTTIIPGQSVFLDSVSTIVTDFLPAQVFLMINGNLPTPCHQFGQINQRLKDNKFEISMHLAPPSPNTLCAQVIQPFEKIIPLQVYGLPAGTYEYTVNGQHAGTFSLTIDNNFPIKIIKLRHGAAVHHISI